MAFEAAGRNVERDLVVDAQFDNRVFHGVAGMQRGIHICRGNAPGGRCVASGGLGVSADTVFPRLANYDTLLFEYNTGRTGDSSRSST